MTTPSVLSDQPTLYYDGSCGLCQREIRHLRPRLESQIALVDISEPDFQPPSGYSTKAMLERIHFYDGSVMKVGFTATLAYWRLANWRIVTALLSLPGIFHIGDFAYNSWAKWRLRRMQCAPSGSR